ncbi:plexin domain-containing protein 2 isoform X2 [Episyrphus balteatus]|uniref:plexin domain-containing protein 2 isoform X2 n=1 Tax=Episyrphus balteatus TaxID=286459 RepID=UPI002486ABF5|nr:plexin domain-containing protein 2 isoform X2 [Episyrphus balteatus]
MAKVYGAGATAIGLIFLFINYGFCVSLEFEQRYQYNALTDSSNLSELGSYSIVKLREKRQTDSKTHYQSVPQDPNAPLPEQSNSTTSVDVKQEPPGNVTLSTTATPSIIIPIVVNQKPLLGVNGTGQRKDFSDKLTTKPPVVSDPIQPDATKKPATFPKKTLSGVSSVPTLIISTESPDKIAENVDVPENETLSDLENRHYTVNQTSDHHIYYNSTIYVSKDTADEYWSSFKNITPNSMLSASHRRAMTVELKFDFPFYGNPVKNVTVATGGFLYTGDYVHSWLAATQYIAPLMANFDTSLSNDSYVRFKDNGTAFTVIWEKVSLQDKQDVGTFTFSTTLHKNGDIVFTYYNVPILINAIQDDKHPVKVGLSDAYIIDKVVFFARRKTIYEYHRVNFGSSDITNSTVIYLKALPTCLTYTDCASCIQHQTSFECQWCPVLNRCSTGTDRKRQEWLHKGCDRGPINVVNLCPAIGQKGNNAAQTTNQTIIDHGENSHNGEYFPVKPSEENPETSYTSQSVFPINKAATNFSTADGGDVHSMGVVLGFIVPICLVITLLVWVLYAYRNPHTKSGQLLIQYRPSQWTWRRGEARYTAATIHM